MSVRLEMKGSEENAGFPMLVTLFGIVTLVTLLSRNVFGLRDVTGRPSIVLGMATTTVVPWYPVIVTIWLVTV